VLSLRSARNEKISSHNLQAEGVEKMNPAVIVVGVVAVVAVGVGAVIKKKRSK